MNHMTIRYPPRREPRVLAIASTASGLAFATADPWVVRGAGGLACRPGARLAAIARLARREKPTALIAANAAARRPIRRVGRTQGVPVLTEALPVLPAVIARELYPELPLLAPNRLAPIAAVAIAAVLHAPIPPRRYAPRRRRPLARRSR